MTKEQALALPPSWRGTVIVNGKPVNR
jgi:hypothetical protein